MYKNIMVPLDGSELAECVLPHVDALAKGCQMENVTFVRVVEDVRMPGGAEAGLDDKQLKEMFASRKAEAEQYLNQLVKRTKFDKVNVKKVLLKGSVADTLADYATKNDVDLILISTHGRSGISRWIWGSVADRILRSACVPVFMIRAPGCVPGVTG